MARTIAATDAIQYCLRAAAVICYLARGPGAAIRRARTRLPGGAPNRVAIIRVQRERTVGHGLASSLIHEVGHQGAALLCLVESLRPRSYPPGRSLPGGGTAWTGLHLGGSGRLGFGPGARNWLSLAAPDLDGY
jgi:hypothetical protein